MDIDHTRRYPFAASVNDFGTIGAQALAHSNDFSIAKQNICVVEPLARAGQNGGPGQQCRNRWQAFVAARVRSRTRIVCIIVAARSNQDESRECDDLLIHLNTPWQNLFSFFATLLLNSESFIHNNVP